MEDKVVPGAILLGGVNRKSLNLFFSIFFLRVTTGWFMIFSRRQFRNSSEFIGSLILKVHLGEEVEGEAERKEFSSSDVKERKSWCFSFPLSYFHSSRISFFLFFFLSVWNLMV